MNIGVDIDDVVADYVNTLNTYANKQYGFKFSREDYKTYSFNETWKLPAEEFTAKFRPWRTSAEFAAMPAVPHAVEVLSQLAKDHMIRFITSRHDDVEHITEAWLKSTFSFPIHLHHSFNKFVEKSSRKKKLELCKDLAIDIMIEDSPEFAKECADGGIPVILLDAPWNRSLEDARIVRVADWLQVAAVLETLRKE